jgi:hypothetical protein
MWLPFTRSSFSSFFFSGGGREIGDRPSLN